VADFDSSSARAATDRPRQTRTTAILLLVYAGFLLLHVGTTVRLATAVPFHSYLDEQLHLSYALHLQENPALVPDYPEMRVVDPDDFSIWLDEKNFLPHPSLYYHLINLLSGQHGQPPADQLAPLRFANVGISALTVLLMLMLGWFHLERPVEHLVYAATIVMAPKIPVLGGMIQNDNMALLGGALTALGLMRFLKGSISPTTATMVGAGFALGAAAKLTAGVLLGFWILLSHLSLLRQLRGGERTVRVYLLCLSAVAVIGILPYIANLASHGTPLYFDKSLFGYRGPHPDLNPVQYLAAFIYSLVATWPAVTPGRLAVYVELFAVLGLSVFGVWRWRVWHGGESRPALVAFAVTALIAILVTLPLHFAFSYDLHVETGNLASVHFRHYLPLWAGFAVGVVLGIRRMLRWRIAGAVAILILLALLTYGYVDVHSLPERCGRDDTLKGTEEPDWPCGIAGRPTQTFA
jgi:hypothetical protein